MPFSPGLYLVATPIGHADDVTLRALAILREADVIAAEDTRQARKLMEIHGISVSGRPVLAYHDHNGPQVRPRLLRDVQDGKVVAYASDAGTPLVADPGYRLAEAMIAEGLPVVAAPGASAVLAALSVAGLPTDRFMFAGFLPVKQAARTSGLAELAAVPATLIFYESPRRLAATLGDMLAVLGDRPAAVCRELTKKFEETRRGGVADLAAHYMENGPPKGEVVIVTGPPLAEALSEADLDTALRSALAESSLKDAAALVAEATGLPRKQVYARALELAGK